MFSVYLVQNTVTFEKVVDEITTLQTYQYTRRTQTLISPPTVYTPAKSPCSFLGQTTRYSKETGLPCGVSQKCSNPVQADRRVFQINLEQIIEFFEELQAAIDPMSILKKPWDVIQVAPLEALKLKNPGEWKETPGKEVLHDVSNRIRKVKEQLEYRLTESRKLLPDQVDDLEYTKPL